MTTVTRRILIAALAMFTITLTGCPPTDMMDNGDTPPTDMNGDNGGDGMADDGNGGDQPTDGDMPGDGGSNDGDGGDGGTDDGMSGDGGGDDGMTDDGMGDSGGDDNDMDGGTDGGTGGGGGSVNLPEPDLDTESPGCTLTLTGDGTNPGAGADREFISTTFVLDESAGSVIVRPVLPPPFDGNALTVTPDSNAVVNFICGDTISLGGITFVDGNGNASTPGEISFDREADVRCGDPITVTFNFPCSVTLTSP